ncbi:MAG: cytochrome c oxidase assembly protein [Candidatus Andeanibacterium colombiense]|uniref:Cytochrome c oxidase assembly protein CtaG n=1 Tax=Candidatus Andeanibacterium colombiense TaxID=3121345 RepID=A0AAJ6BNY9_9SPHN|nr:MAG: cytochrome c oxidase assembly protein [Sphingomonadaceae bacterium]
MTAAARNRKVGLAGFGAALAMLALGFASVPLYRLFCQKTGFGGTPQIASEAQAATVSSIDQTISVRFDSNIDKDVPWKFMPEKTTQTVKLGERYMAFFVAKNNSDKPVTGQASYNIEPEQAAVYFNKIQCFCFTRQTLKPHEEVRMPVTFYVDPKMLKDENARDVEQITLSYTFHKTKEPS